MAKSYIQLPPTTRCTDKSTSMPRKQRPSPMKSISAPRRKLTLMTLPTEIREVIYQHVFSYRRPLYTARAGRLIINKEARRDMQCLRTCLTFYCEAMPQIYAINTLEIEYDDMRALACVPREAEILVGNVIIHCRRDQFINEESGQNVEEIDFGMLGHACPNITSVEIYTYSSGSLLWVTQKLARSLPCSSIRDWPLLRVDVEISDNISEFDNANFAKRAGKIVHSVRMAELGLSWLNARSGFRLGYEMPRHLKTLHVLGKLSERLCECLLGRHTCSFGDCSFKKEIPAQAITSTASSIESSAEKVRYTWHKTGELIPLNEEHEAKVMAAMNQWVPKLDQREYETMTDCGYSVSPEKFKPFNAASLPRMGMHP